MPDQVVSLSALAYGNLFEFVFQLISKLVVQIEGTREEKSSGRIAYSLFLYSDLDSRLHKSVKSSISHGILMHPLDSLFIHLNE